MTIGGGSFELIRYKDKWLPRSHWQRGPYRRLFVRFPSITFARGKFEYATKARDDAAEWAAIKAATEKVDWVKVRVVASK